MKALYHAMAILLFTGGAYLGATDAYWNVPDGGDWSEASNWTNNIVADGAGVIARFTDFPGPGSSRPLILLDQDIMLGGLRFWVGDSSTFLFASKLKPDGSLYGVDLGADPFRIFTNRGVSWKIPLSGAGEVAFEPSTGGLFEFRVPQAFTGPLVLGNRSSYKGFAYQSYADSTSSTPGDMLATREVRLDYATLRFSGRYARNAGSWPTWELRPGEPLVKFLGTNANVETFFSPGQVVSGDHIQAGTFVRFFPAPDAMVLSQPVADDFEGVVVQALSFAAAPRWDVTQRLERLVSSSSEGVAVGGVQFSPCGIGNSLTLHTDELTGNRPLLVSVNNGYGGSDGRLRAGHVESFGQKITLNDTAALILDRQRELPETPAPDAAFWVDASDGDSLTVDVDGRVSRWNDTRGNDYPFAESWLEKPLLVAEALNGLPVVDFGAQGDARGLGWNIELDKIQTVFWVIGSQAGGGSLLGRGPAGSEHFFKRGFDALKAGTDYIGLENGLIGINEEAGENLWLNGELTHMSGSGLSGDYDLVTAQLNAARQNVRASAFGYVATLSTQFHGGQRLAEVIVYTNTLSTQQIQDTEAYLMKKWFDRERRGYGSGKVHHLAMGANSNARLGTTGSGVSEVRYLEANGKLTVLADSEIRLPADGALQGMAIEDGAKAILSARQVPIAPPLAGSILWLDASCEADFTMDGGLVAAWRNRGGGSVSTVTPGSVKPSRVQDAEGRWLVDLGPRENGCGRMTLSNLMTRSAFIVWFPYTNGAQPLGSLAKDYAGHGEFRPNDFNRKGGSAWLNGATRTALNGQWFIDGTPTPPASAVPTNRLLLTSGVMQGWGGRVSAIGGIGFNNTPAKYQYSGGFKLAEMLLYDRSLSYEERRDVEAYLTRKWFGATLSGYTAENGAVEIAELVIDGDATLENSGNAIIHVGTVLGEGTLTTTGDAPIVIGNVPNSHKVSVPAAVGGVRVRRAGEEAPGAPVAGATMHFDASAPSSITVYKSGGIDYAKNWEDLVGGVKAESAYGPESWLPKINAGAVNGLTAINFDKRGSNRGFKWSPRLTNIRSVFWMVKDKGATEGGGFLLGNTDTTYANSHFARGGNNGTLLGHSPLFHDSRSSPGVRGGSIYIDGEPRTFNDVPKWDWQAISVVTTSDTSADQIAADRTLWANSGGLEVGEIIIYATALTPAECAANEDYLMNKWLNRRSPRLAGVTTQSVVTAWGPAPLTVEALAEGENQVLALRGDGNVIVDNSAIEILSDAEIFSGRVTLRNDSSVTLRAASYAASEWFVEAGSVLDLGGRTVALAGIGGDGCVSNGTVVASRIVPGLDDAPGILTVKGDLVLHDGAEIAAVYERPVCGKLVVNGKLTVAGGGSVALPPPAALKQGFSAPLIEYGTIDGLSNLLTLWTCDGDASLEAFNFHLESGTGNQVLLRGFAPGTLILLR